MRFNRFIPAAVVALGLSVAPAFAGDGDGPPPAPQPPSRGSIILSVPQVQPAVVVDKE